MFYTSILKEVTHYVKQLSKLRENKYFVTGSNHFGQHAVQELEFSTRHPDPVWDFFREIIKKQVGMIHDLS